LRPDQTVARISGLHGLGRALVELLAGADAVGRRVRPRDLACLDQRLEAAQLVLALGVLLAAVDLDVDLGAAIAGRLADRFGRIRVMQAASVLFTASAVGSALPFALWDLAMWRVLGGIAIGMASVVAPAYIAEVSPPAYRGRLASFQQAAIVVARTRGGVPRSGILGQS
jgi:MFS family permease